MKGNKELVYTIEEHCRVCYTCVRECPAKAIRISGGQAGVIQERCIGCGNCVKVCSQGAKVFVPSVSEVEDLINSKDMVVACIAPSFPAEFTEIEDYKQVVGMVKALGFDRVTEVAFGADLVAEQYKKIIKNNVEIGCISSDCPAIVLYIEHYYPDLVASLAPIVSPMVAMTRVIKQKYGEDTKVVFMGPCLAKKLESDEVDAVITFRELRSMLLKKEINSDEVEASDFDAPKAGRGAIFPISRGLLQTINISEDFLEGNVIVADGRVNFQDAIREFESGLLKSQHLELLCCEGCIMGAGMSHDGERYARKIRVRDYVIDKLNYIDEKQWEKDIDEFNSLDLTQTFEQSDQRIPKPSPDQIVEVLEAMGKKSFRDHLNCGACGYDTCEEHAIAIIKGLAEEEMCLPHSIEKLHQSIDDLAISNEKLASVQQALKQSEKLAHMGQLSAGIAHELNNPLGVLMMYSNILLDDCPRDSQMRKDLELIVDQAVRCKNIVGGLLNFARKNQVFFSEVDIVKLVRHSIGSVIVPENISIKVTSFVKNPLLPLDKDQIIQVITNLLKNAIEAMPDGGEVKIRLEDTISEVTLEITDTGLGIEQENLEKIFEPFFTTKGIGKGTGLGLAIIYGIVKMHKGQITVESNTDQSKGLTGTTFKIVLPKTLINA